MKPTNTSPFPPAGSSLPPSLYPDGSVQTLAPTSLRACGFVSISPVDGGCLRRGECFLLSPVPIAQPGAWPTGTSGRGPREREDGGDEEG